ncbi:MAG: transglycosylase domain-containing protein [Limnochordia bacterium]|jgi:penicillin-binding protein 1A
MGRKKRRFGRARATLLVFFVSITIGTLAGVLAGYVSSAPTLAEVTFNPKLTTYIYDADGRVLARLFKENRDAVRLSQIPIHMRQAAIAAEDSHFYTHYGVNLRGIFRALIVNVRVGEIRQGGSTITQQLAKNAFLSHERTVSRKLRELLWAVQIERRYSKDEILEAYLNEVFFGHGAYGVEAAAKLYFGKRCSDLTLSEAAFLAGVINGPSVFSPFVDRDAAVRRRNYVLDRMRQLGYITVEQAMAAAQSPLRTVPLQSHQTQASYFVDYVLQQIIELFGEQRVYTGGLRVYTTLDLRWQQTAEKALLSKLPTLKTDANGLRQPQGALLAVDPSTGEIKAMVGGRGTDKFNRAVQAYRQPGSAIKPILYAAALEAGYTPATIMKDEPLTLKTGDGTTWKPDNYDRRHRGDVTLQEALEESINTIAVKLLQEMGPRAVIAYGQRLGISTFVEHGEKNDLNASLALGGLTKGTSPLELTAAYLPFANGGTYVAPYAISRVEDSDGTLLYQAKTVTQTVMNQAQAFVMTHMMKGVIERGTGRRAAIGRPAAGKTGTTSDYTNAWFIGYTPQLIATVWIGNDLQREPMRGPDGDIGSGLAADIWASFMGQVLVDHPEKDFVPPRSGVIGPLAIDRANGLLVQPDCLLADSELIHAYFLEDSAPQTITPRCQNSTIVTPDPPSPGSPSR